jgi:hypothetical protein
MNATFAKLSRGVLVITCLMRGNVALPTDPNQCDRQSAKAHELVLALKLSKDPAVKESIADQLEKIGNKEAVEALYRYGRSEVEIEKNLDHIELYEWRLEDLPGFQVATLTAAPSALKEWVSQKVSGGRKNQNKCNTIVNQSNNGKYWWATLECTPPTDPDGNGNPASYITALWEGGKISRIGPDTHLKSRGGSNCFLLERGKTIVRKYSKREIELEMSKHPRNEEEGAPHKIADADFASAVKKFRKRRPDCENAAIWYDKAGVLVLSELICNKIEKEGEGTKEHNILLRLKKGDPIIEAGAVGGGPGNDIGRQIVALLDLNGDGNIQILLAPSTEGTDVETYYELLSWNGARFGRFRYLR